MAFCEPAVTSGRQRIEGRYGNGGIPCFLNVLGNDTNDYRWLLGSLTDFLVLSCFWFRRSLGTELVRESFLAD